MKAELGNTGKQRHWVRRFRKRTEGQLRCRSLSGSKESKASKASGAGVQTREKCPGYWLGKAC